MKSFTIEDIKTFMSDLLIKDVFDTFNVTEVQITTYNTFTIDGHINQSFYSPDELELLPDAEVSLWSALRPLCFDIIKGKKIPSRFKIVFMKRPEENQSVDALFLNIKYENNIINCITGVSMKSFSMDKTIETEWDDKISKLLANY